MGDSSDLARDGDPAAFRILIRRHDRYLYRIARSVLLDDHEAEDVVQETYILAFTRLARITKHARDAGDNPILPASAREPAG